MEKDPGPGKPGDSKILRAILILGGAAVGVGSTLFADWGAGHTSGMGLAIAALFGGWVVSVLHGWIKEAQ
jgi:hypothetical protein